MDEADAHFRGGGTVREALRETGTQRLERPWCRRTPSCGGMAVVRYGLNRFTDDVDLLVTHEGGAGAGIHENLRGRGYLPPFEQSKNLRDTRRGVRVEFLITAGHASRQTARITADPVPRSHGRGGGVQRHPLPRSLPKLVTS